MLTRSEQQSVEAAVEKNFDVKQYAWHKYTSARGTKLKGPRGSEVVLRNGDLYGVKEYNSKQDMYLVLKMPTAVFKINIPASDKLMNEKSVEVKGKKPTLPKNPPTKIKVDMAPPAKKKTVKEAAAPSDMTYEASPIVCSHCKKKAKHGVIIKGKKYAIDCGADKLGLTTASLKKLIGAAAPASKPSTEKAPKVVKPKLTANQKKIVAVKMEIKRLRGLTQNATNLRKVEAQKAELKKLNAKEKLAAKKEPIAPKVKEPKATPQKESAAPQAPKKDKAPNVTLPPEFEAARTLLKAIDKGGVPLNTMKLNLIGRELGLDIASNAKPDATIERIRAAVQRAVESARAEVQHSKKPTRVKVNLAPDDDDDDEFDHGGIVDIDELEFDDDVSGLVDIPLPESWSASTSGAKRKSKRMILDDDEEEAA